MPFQSVPARQAGDLVARGAQLVDVREPDEFATGSLPEAVNVPLSEFTARYAELDSGRPVAVLCRSGARSARVAGFLAERGYGDVTNLDGGLLAV